MRAILAGGGTGGHVIPALAIANQLKKSYGAEVLFIGTARGIENRLVPAAGYPLQLVRVGALKNVSLVTRLKTAFDLPRAVWDAGRMLNEFAPDVVIGVGGYASGPAMLAALVKHIPTLAFEPNVVPGFANRVVARFVSAAAVHFEETAKYFRHAEVTGVPVRQAFFEIAALSTNKKCGGEPTLLLFGGSQGAHAINQAMIRCLPVLRQDAPGIHIIHQTGERDYNDADCSIQRASRRRVSRLKFSSSSKTCRRRLHARTWWCAARVRAPWRKLRRPGSLRFLFRFRAQRTTISG
jgi:UDP-N-acetylglucosamine--N-acetylmuramyl-(pentapeptide) pyrophosphoryl-undecaprenol N-acetylglucosamine transferase